MKRQYIIPIFISNNECVDDCENCNTRELNVEKLTREDIKNKIEEHLKQVKEHSKVEIAFLGGCFTALKKEKRKELLEEAYTYVKAKKVQAIRISTTPNYISREILKELKKYKVKTIELYAPSSNDYILQKSRIKYNFDTLKRSSKMIKLYGFDLGYKMMIGLPESTYIDEINTARELIKLRPKMVRINIVVVIRGTFLEKIYEERKYKELTLTQAIETCKELMKLFARKKIEVIRIGYEVDNVYSNKGKIQNNIIAGPYHMNFRGLVESGMWYDVIVEKIKKLNTKVKEVEFMVNPIDIDNAIGINRENIEKLKDVYDVDLIIKADSQIKQGKSKIQVTKVY